jgi:hypothetical protein
MLHEPSSASQPLNHEIPRLDSMSSCPYLISSGCVCLLHRQYGSCGWCRRSGRVVAACAPIDEPCSDDEEWPGKACGY